jgi:hypothetical protein
MINVHDFIQLKTVQGTAVHTPHHTLIPESQAISLRFPYGGIVWQRPTAVLVQKNNQLHRYLIIDITRIVVWSFLGFSLLFPLFLRIIRSTK